MSQVLKNNKVSSENSLENSEEFMAKVQEVAAKVVAEALSKMQSSSDAQSIGKSIALEMARMTGSTDGKEYVDPEILQARAEHRKKMHELIDMAKERYGRSQKKEDMPAYRLVNKFFVGKKLLQPSIIGQGGAYTPRIIGWEDVPNEAMVPVNKAARDIYDEFKLSIGVTLDPVAKEEIWVNAEGVAKYGKNPEQLAATSFVSSHPSLIEDYNGVQRSNVMDVRFHVDSNEYAIPIA